MLAAVDWENQRTLGYHLREVELRGHGLLGGRVCRSGPSKVPPCTSAANARATEARCKDCHGHLQRSSCSLYLMAAMVIHWCR